MVEGSQLAPALASLAVSHKEVHVKFTHQSSLSDMRRKR